MADPGADPSHDPLPAERFLTVREAVGGLTILTSALSVWTDCQPQGYSLSERSLSEHVPAIACRVPKAVDSAEVDSMLAELFEISEGHDEPSLFFRMLKVRNKHVHFLNFWRSFGEATRMLNRFRACSLQNSITESLAEEIETLRDTLLREIDSQYHDVPHGHGVHALEERIEHGVEKLLDSLLRHGCHPVAVARPRLEEMVSTAAAMSSSPDFWRVVKLDLRSAAWSQVDHFTMDDLTVLLLTWLKGLNAEQPYELSEAVDCDHLFEGLHEAQDHYNHVLKASEAQHCLVKTISNDDWLVFVRRLQGQRFRTPTTLTPPSARNMRLFGTKLSNTTCCLGILWDYRELDLSDAYIWPSGYAAKSEFNVGSDGTLKNGRQEAMVTIEELTQHNAQDVGSDHEISFNEVCTYVHGAIGIKGIFCRSTLVNNLVWGMGMRALLRRALPDVGNLPLFLHDIDHGLRPFGCDAQRRVAQEFINHPSLAAEDQPLLPVDTQFLEMSVLDQLNFHAAYGITGEALAEIVRRLTASAGDYRADARAMLIYGLQKAIKTSNASSARSLLMAVAPAFFNSEFLGSVSPTNKSISHRSSENGLREVLSACLRKLESRDVSKSMFITLGATIALDDITCGIMVPRVEEACKELEEWLGNADSVMFRIQSWRELKVTSENSAMSAFMTHHAIHNRTSFCRALTECMQLLKTGDLISALRSLHALTSELMHPCLRLRMLQQILGVDARYDVQAVIDVAALALNVLSGISSAGAELEKHPVLPHDSLLGPIFQLEEAGCNMMGVEVSDVNQRSRIRSGG